MSLVISKVKGYIKEEREEKGEKEGVRVVIKKWANNLRGRGKEEKVDRGWESNKASLRWPNRRPASLLNHVILDVSRH